MKGATKSSLNVLLIEHNPSSVGSMLISICIGFCKSVKKRSITFHSCIRQRPTKKSREALSMPYKKSTTRLERVLQCRDMTTSNIRGATLIFVRRRRQIPVELFVMLNVSHSEQNTVDCAHLRIFGSFSTHFRPLLQHKSIGLLQNNRSSSAYKQNRYF